VPSEVLSPDEIEKLLEAIKAGDTEPEDFRPALESRKIKIYDFMRPDKFSKEQIRTVAIIHEKFSRLVTSFLSSYLKTDCYVHVASVDQLTYEEFIRCIPTPTCIAILNMDPLNGMSCLEIDPAITFSMINLLVGGGKENDLRCQHELTRLESLLMEEIIIRFLGSLRESWTDVIDLRPKLSQIDTNPQFIQMVHPTEMTALVIFEVKINDTEGMMNFCIPYSTIESIIGKFSAQFWYKTYEKWTDVKPNIDDISLNLRARLLNRVVTKKYLEGLTINSVIPAKSNIRDYCEIVIWNTHAFNAKIEKNLIITEKVNIVEGNYMEEKTNIQPSVSLDDVQVMLSVELGRTRKTIKEVLSMGEGSIIELDSLAGEPVSVYANNVLIAKGEVVVIDENFGIRIVEILNKV
jgi:flagellar motor switch protein FliM